MKELLAVMLKRKAVSAALLLMLAAASFALWKADLLSGVFPSEARIKAEAKELKRAQAALQAGLDEAAELKFRRDAFAAASLAYWVPKRDGKPEALAPGMLERAGKQASLELSSLGELRRVRLDEGLSSLEMDVAASGSLEAVVRFLAEVRRGKPEARWRRCEIKPDPAKDSRKVSFSGSAAFLCVEDGKAAGLSLSAAEGGD